MAKYIHVTTADKIPENRGSSGSPFEEYDSDPNQLSGFGPGERTMFLAVDEPAKPTVNAVLQKVDATFTLSTTAKNIRGVYVPGEELWRASWEVTAQDIETSRSLKKEELLSDRTAALDAGYTISNYSLPYTEAYFAALTSRKTWMTIAIAEGDILGTDTVVLQDKNGRKAELTNAQFDHHYSLYGLAYTDIDGIDHDASEQIDDALTPAEVDVVAWDFGS